MIMAVEPFTTSEMIQNVLLPYCSIYSIYMEEFSTNAGGKYNRVYIEIKSWNNNTITRTFIKSIQNGTARLNYWWDIRKNTEYKLLDDVPHVKHMYNYMRIGI